MESTTILKYKNKPSTTLKKSAQSAFNAWIRKRDEGKGCISCGSQNDIQGGHFYSAGHYSNLRFHEDNVHSQCMRCNYFLSGNLNEYRKNLENKIGIEKLLNLDHLSRNRQINHNDRFLYIEILEKYRPRKKQRNIKTNVQIC